MLRIKEKNDLQRKKKYPIFAAIKIAAPIGIVMMLCSPARLPCVADGHFFCTYAMFFVPDAKFFGIYFVPLAAY